MMGGPQYRLLADHYISDQLLTAGTIIGEGTAFPYVSVDGEPVAPSIQMEPLNDSAKQMVEKVADWRRGNPVDQAAPVTPKEREKK